MAQTSKLMKMLARYVIAIGGVVLAWLLREAFTPIWGPTSLPFIFFYPAVVLAAWYGRLRLAILSIGLSVLAATYFFIEPRHTLWTSNTGELIGLISFVGVSLIIAVAIESMHRANDRVNLVSGESRRADEASAHLAAIVTSSADAIISKSLQGIVTSWNDGAEAMFGYTAAEMIGQPILRLIPEDLQAEEDYILSRLRAGERVEHFETVRLCKDGTPVDVSLTISPIKNSSGQIIGASKIARDITERKIAEAELEMFLAREQELRLAAEESNRLKDEFLATMSHELRNPLNVILGYSELLLRTDEIRNSPQLLKMGEALRRNALAQSHLIRDLLDLSRLRSGKLTLNAETVSVITAITNAVETVRADAAAKAIKLTIDAPDGALFVQGELLRLEQIVWNLLTNAVKFTPAGGSISVRVAKDGTDAVLTVADTGQGIDAAFLPHVFEMFRQADASTSRAQSGMGIGLALVRQLVELHRGVVSVRSAGHGLGASFIVRLPRTAETETMIPAPLELTPRTLNKLGVLVLDDSEDTIEMLRHLLEQGGARVTTATSGVEALRLASEREFDVVLSDISMPGMDGFEFVRRLRELPGKKDVPVLALTGFGRPEDINRAQNEGFFSHLTKPFDLGTLSEILEAVPTRKH
jgi:two-component system CheB/CheR fusion protein